MSLDDDRLALSYESCVRNFYILDDVNKTLARIESKKEAGAEGEIKTSSEMAEHYAQKFDELYDMFNTRVGRK